jgi:hypothetical protein
MLASPGTSRSSCLPNTYARLSGVGQLKGRWGQFRALAASVDLTSTLLPGMSGWRCCLPMMAASITSAGRFSPLGPRAHLPLVEVKISGPHGAGQYLRRALSACFLDFDHYRCRVDFRLCLSARCGNIIESCPESINPDFSLQSKCLGRLPVSAAHAPYSHHVDRNSGILRRGKADWSGAN